MKIQVQTLFDCSNTGTTGHFRPHDLPRRDRADFVIKDHVTWQRSRNKQRNHETLLQILGLRCQLENISDTECHDGVWQFTFEVDNPEIYGPNQSLELLLRDCQGVPMVTDLEEDTPTSAMLITQGEQQNIWFQTINT